jgi:hypothetical protein
MKPLTPRAAEQVRSYLYWYEARIFDFEGLVFPFLPSELPRIKRALHFALPGIRSTTRLEIFARSCGYRTAAALQADAATGTSFEGHPNPYEHAEWITKAVAGAVGEDEAHWRALRVICEITRGWVMRTRYGWPQITDQKDLIALGEAWTPSQDAAYLARYILHTNQIGAFVAMSATVAKSEGGRPCFETCAAAVGLALALDGVCFGAEIPHLGAAEAVQGEAWNAVQHAAEGITSSASIDRMQDLLEHPDFSWDMLNTSPDRGWCGEARLNELVFDAALSLGFQAEISTLRATSLLLAVLATHFPVEDACDRLDISIEDLFAILPELEDLDRTVFGSEAAGSEAATEWIDRPLLDVWRGCGFSIDVPASALVLPNWV